VADRSLSSTPLSRHPAFVCYWAARAATSFGYQMQAVAVAYQVYELTGRPFDLGLVGLAQFLPAFLLALAAGQVADRFDRRRVVGVCQGVQCLALLALAGMGLGAAVGLPAIFTVIVGVGAARAFEAPTMQALLPALVPPALLPRAVAASASANQTATVLGPAAGGVLYGIAGPYAVFAGAATLFLAAALAMLTIRVAPRTVAREPVSLRSVFAGVAFIWRRPIVLGAISLDLFAVLLGGATALLPVYARDILQVGPSGLGALRSAPAVGALVMSVVLARRLPQQRIGCVMFAGVALYGIATIVFALSAWFALSLLALALLGAGDMVSVVIRSSLIQLSTPDEMRGRVSAVNSVFIGTSNQLGDFRAGMMAAWLGAVPAVLLGGVGTLVVVLAWMRMFPALLRIDRLGAGR